MDAIESPDNTQQ